MITAHNSPLVSGARAGGPAPRAVRLLRAICLQGQRVEEGAKVGPGTDHLLDESTLSALVSANQGAWIKAKAVQTPAPTKKAAADGAADDSEKGKP